MDKIVLPPKICDYLRRITNTSVWDINEWYEIKGLLSSVILSADSPSIYICGLDRVYREGIITYYLSDEIGSYNILFMILPHEQILEDILSSNLLLLSKVDAESLISSFGHWFSIGGYGGNGYKILLRYIRILML